MADYNSVPPPDAQIDQATAIQDAMARAKQVGILFVFLHCPQGKS